MNQKKEIKGMFDGPILPLLKKLALPIFLGMCLQIIYNITDRFWVGRIDTADPSYLGAVGLIYPVLFLAIAISSGINVGISSIVARCIGSKKYSQLSKTAESGLLISFIVAVIMLTAIYLFDKSILGALGAEGDFLLRGSNYLRYLIPTAAILFFTNVFTGILQGEGLMKHVMLSFLISTVANIILDPVFIFLLGMNVKGAGLATSISSLLSLAYVLHIFLTGKSSVKISWKIANIDLGVIKEIFSIGGLQTLSQVLVAVSLFIFNGIMIDLDKIALTAYTLCLSFEQLILYVMFAISSAVVTIIGQNYGRQLLDRVKRTWNTALVTACVIVGFIAILFFIFAPVIFSWFTDIEGVINYAVLYIRIVEFSFIFTSFSIIARAYFQAIGRPLPGFILTLIRLIIITVPVAYLLAYQFNMGIRGAWIGIIAGNLISAAISLFWVNETIKQQTSEALRPVGDALECL